MRKATRLRDRGKQPAALLDEGDSVHRSSPRCRSMPSSSRQAWFDAARGGVVTPYFFGLACDDAAGLRLVGFGSLADAAIWE
ncbi:MAG: hypothetical protein R6X02_16075 [Enhygromyxa sp.]